MSFIVVRWNFIYSELSGIKWTFKGTSSRTASGAFCWSFLTVSIGRSIHVFMVTVKLFNLAINTERRCNRRIIFSRGFVTPNRRGFEVSINNSIDNCWGKFFCDYKPCKRKGWLSVYLLQRNSQTSKTSNFPKEQNILCCDHLYRLPLPNNSPNENVG